MRSDQLTLGLGAAASFRPEDFLLSDSNRGAWAFVQGTAAWSTAQGLLYGPAASGKTHLAHLWAERAGATIHTLSPGALPDGPAVLEDIERYPAETLFHWLNQARGQNQPLLLTLTANTPVGAFTLPDLASRLRALPQAKLEAPDDALLEAVLQKLFADRQLRVGAHVTRYLTARIERSFAAAQAAVAALDDASLKAKKPVTLPFVREWWSASPHDLFTPPL